MLLIILNVVSKIRIWFLFNRFLSFDLSDKHFLGAVFNLLLEIVHRAFEWYDHGQILLANE